VARWSRPRGGDAAIGDGLDARNVVTTLAAHHRAGRHPSAPQLSATNAALLIDFDNVTLGVRSDLTKELRHLLDSDIIKGKVSVQRAYADWRRYPQYIVPLSESSIDLIFAPAFGTSKKNATDIRLAIDATELVFTRPEIGTFILLSGDSDFSSLVIKLKEYGKYVIGVGIRESASDILIQNCDEYYSYTELAGLTKEVDTPSTQRDPWELVVEAVDRMVANRDVMRADRLKQVMQQIDPNFDESNAGFNRFSKFVQEAASRGLIGLAKMENGQFEVAPVPGRPAPGRDAAPGNGATKAGTGRQGRGRGGRREGAVADKTPVAATPAASVPAVTVESPKDTEPDKDKERGRRRRRGGRGRTRTDERPEAAPTVSAVSSHDGLTLAEALHLMTRALGELPAPVAHETLRARMAALHGREDPLLDAAQFPRLLRQANDAETADVRMIDETHFEVSPHKTDLALQRRPAAEVASGDAAVPTTTVSAPKGVRFRAGSNGAKRSGQLRLVGVVTLDNAADPAPKTAPEPTAPAAAPIDPPARGARQSGAKRSGAKRSGAKADETKSGPSAKTPQPKSTARAKSPKTTKAAKAAKATKAAPKTASKSATAPAQKAAPKKRAKAAKTSAAATRK
jgi:uncharacterized protein (TIGR00288 family)